MPIRNNLFLVAMGLLCVVGGARGQDAPVPPVSVSAPKPPPVIQSKAVADFYRRHQKAKTISFTATYYAHGVVSLGFIQMNTYVVQFQRPNLFAVRGGPALMRVITEGDRESLEFSSNLLNVCICNGKTVQEYDTRSRIYEKSPVPVRFESSFGALQSVKADLALSNEMLYGFAPAPDETSYGRRVLVFTQTNTANPRGSEVEKLYFAAEKGELMQYSIFFQYQFKGPFKESERVEYRDWKLNARLPRDTFTLALPADVRQVPPVVARTPAAPAPEKH